MVGTKKIEIEGKEWIIKRWTTKDKAEIDNASVEPISEFKDGEFKVVKTISRTDLYTLHAIVKGIAEAPKDVLPEITVEAVGALDHAIGERLYREIAAFNRGPFPSEHS